MNMVEERTVEIVGRKNPDRSVKCLKSMKEESEDEDNDCCTREIGEVEDIST